MWPLAGHAQLGQHVVVGSMIVLRVALGNLPRGVCLDPRLHGKRTSARLSGELPLCEKNVQSAFFAGIWTPLIRAFSDCSLPWGEVRMRCQWNGVRLACLVMGYGGLATPGHCSAQCRDMTSRGPRRQR